MNYLSIDIETTGLNVKHDMILEFAAVLWTDNDVMKCPSFHRMIYHDRITGHPFALHMNKRWLDAWVLLDGGPGTGWARTGDFCTQFREWLEPVDKVFPVGKNFASFDKQFLERLSGWPKDKFKHRCLDVGALCATKDGVPGLFDIEISKAIPGNEHDALYDARYALQVAIERVTGAKER